MSRRGLLRRHLAGAWSRTIGQQYCEQLINSEHGLQVYFCMALVKMFEESEVERRLFVKPRLCAKDTKERRYPDVVVCNSRHVIGIVELKYAPNGIPKWRKDIETLAFAATHGPKLTIANNRFLGDGRDPLPYPLAPDAVLCWAGVYTGEPLPLKENVPNELAPRFLQLDAITAPEELPKVRIGGKLLVSPKTA